MSASLVGSEMCIRDRPQPGRRLWSGAGSWGVRLGRRPRGNPTRAPNLSPCLLYTSDAADDM
eukprot:2612709-Alexandrium_andersonii.AAC.1